MLDFFHQQYFDQPLIRNHGLCPLEAFGPVISKGTFVASEQHPSSWWGNEEMAVLPKLRICDKL